MARTSTPQPVSSRRPAVCWKDTEFGNANSFLPIRYRVGFSIVNELGRVEVPISRFLLSIGHCISNATNLIIDPLFERGILGSASSSHVERFDTDRTIFFRQRELGHTSDGTCHAILLPRVLLATGYNNSSVRMGIDSIHIV